MGGSKNTREVWDYLASCDYGLCHGPLDRINQVWVKDKRILCDAIIERTDENVDLPEIFGGDDAEGGVAGTIEFYMGTDDQESSDALASRADRDSATFPGYRGLAHMFMRGKGSKKKGFKWGSMNPYMPKTKVSVTDIPRALSTTNAEIPNSVGVDDDGNYIDADLYVNGAGATVNNKLPFRSYNDASGEFADDGSMPAERLYVADIGLTNEDMQYALDNGWLWQVHMYEEYASSGSLNAKMELRVGYESGAEEVYVLETTGEDQTNDQAVTLGVGVVWFECRTLIDGYAFSRDEFFHMVLASEPITFGEDYIGYLGQDLSWDQQPGTLYYLPDMGFDEDGIASGGGTFTAGLKGFAHNGDGSTGVAVTATLKGRMLDKNGEELPHLDKAWVEGNAGVGQGVVDIHFHRQLHPDCVTVEFKAIVILYVPLFHEFDVHGKYQSISVSMVEAGWCPIDGTGLDILPNANPAHIIYECLTDTDWGRGEPASRVDTASFVDAAQTLYDERFGLSLKWVKSATVQDFIQEVLDHIKAVMGIDPMTGLWYIKLLRDDYDAETLDLWDETNCVATNRKRRAWGDTINEVVVTWTDPNTEEEATVSAYEGGNIAIQGGVVSEGRNYYGIRNAYLAQWVADRDVAEASAPLYTATLHVDRSGWAAKPGDVVKFAWAEDGITELVARIMSVDYGSPKDRKIKVEIVEDIFAVAGTAYAGPGVAIGIGNNALPEDLDAQLAITAPYGTLIHAGYGEAELALAPDLARVMFFGDDDQLSILDIAAHSEVMNASGSTTVQQIAKFPARPSTLLTEALVGEAYSTLPEEILDDLYTGAPAAGDYLLIGTSQDVHELVMLTTQEVSGDWNIVRGVWDTVPLEWPIGSRIWTFPKALGSASDPNERTDGEAVDYYFLMRNTVGRLTLSSASEINYVGTNRANAPFRPANCQLDGQGFGEVNYQENPPATITASWANRNRLVEDSAPFRWDDADTTPETDQTVTLKILDKFGVEQDSITGLTGTSHAIPIATLTPVGVGYVEFVADRDGVESVFAAKRKFTVVATGWGNSWGIGWGE